MYEFLFSKIRLEGLEKIGKNPIRWKWTTLNSLITIIGTSKWSMEARLRRSFTPSHTQHCPLTFISLDRADVPLFSAYDTFFWTPSSHVPKSQYHRCPRPIAHHTNIYRKEHIFSSVWSQERGPERLEICFITTGMPLGHFVVTWSLFSWLVAKIHFFLKKSLKVSRLWVSSNFRRRDWFRFRSKL